ncbi:MAG TPA: DUF6325 family protein [Galbitalea sp.]|jgi:uncharacterized membrane protein
MSLADSPGFDFGPIEFVLLGFEGSAPDAAFLSAIEGLVESDTIRLLDLVIVTSDSAGDVSIVEIDELPEDYGLAALELSASGIAAEEDLIDVTEAMPPGSSAAIAVIELVWAKDLAAKLSASGGFVIHSERVPAVVVNDALATLSQEG